MRALPLNDVSWLGLVSMRAEGGVGQEELLGVGSSPFPLRKAVGALPGCEGCSHTSPTPAHRCFLLGAVQGHLPLQKGL